MRGQTKNSITEEDIRGRAYEITNSAEVATATNWTIGCRRRSS
jgi:hypothetical protein